VLIWAETKFTVTDVTVLLTFWLEFHVDTTHIEDFPQTMPRIPFGRREELRSSHHYYRYLSHSHPSSYQRTRNVHGTGAHRSVVVTYSQSSLFFSRAYQVQGHMSVRFQVPRFTRLAPGYYDTRRLVRGSIRRATRLHQVELASRRECNHNRHNHRCIFNRGYLAMLLANLSSRGCASIHARGRRAAKDAKPKTICILCSVTYY
jgi:hypothetical protein